MTVQQRIVIAAAFLTTEVTYPCIHIPVFLQKTGTCCNCCWHVVACLHAPFRSLLLVTHEMSSYLETIEILYSANTFHSNQFFNVIWFSAGISLFSYHSIRAFEVFWLFDWPFRNMPTDFDLQHCFLVKDFAALMYCTVRPATLSQPVTWCSPLQQFAAYLLTWKALIIWWLPCVVLVLPLPLW